MRVSFLLCLLFVGVTFAALDKKKHCKCRIQANKRIINGNIYFKFSKNQKKITKSKCRKSTGRDVEQLSYPWQVSLEIKDIIPIPDMMKRLLPDQYKVTNH